MHDLVIRGGTVVDGTGGTGPPADVAVDDGRITGVGDHRGRGGDAHDRRRRAARHPGLGRHPHPLRRPGHLGRGARPDRRGTASPPLVMGNCGVGFAPARPDRHDWLIGLMEGVEDIPGTALSEGIDVGVGDLPRVPRRPRQRRVDHRRRHPDRPRRRARLRDGRARRHATSRPPPTTSPRWRDRQGGRRRRRARLLDLAHHRPPGHRRRAGARHLRRRGRAVRHRRRRWASSAPASSSWHRPARPARTSCAPRRRSTGCAACRPRSADRSPSPCSRSTPPPTCGAS